MILQQSVQPSHPRMGWGSGGGTVIVFSKLTDFQVVHFGPSHAKAPELPQPAPRCIWSDDDGFRACMIPNSYPTLDHDLGDTVDLLRDTVRSFTSDNIAPIADEIDRSNTFPRELWPQ